MNRTELAQQIFKTSHLTGQFLLRSEKTSTEYFDKYQFESRPALLREIAKQLIPLLPKTPSISEHLRWSQLRLRDFIRNRNLVAPIRKAAKEYGTCKFAEGPAIKGKRLTLIEDVITTGGQVVISASDLRAATAPLFQACCA